MKEMFIQKSDLGEIMEAVAEKALEHVGTLEVRMSIHKRFLNDEAVLSITVQDDRTMKKYKERSYIIVDDIQDSIDVVDATIGDAVVIMEKEVGEIGKVQEETTSTGNDNEE